MLWRQRHHMLPSFRCLVAGYRAGYHFVVLWCIQSFLLPWRKRNLNQPHSFRQCEHNHQWASVLPGLLEPTYHCLLFLIHHELANWRKVPARVAGQPIFATIGDVCIGTDGRARWVL